MASIKDNGNGKSTIRWREPEARVRTVPNDEAAGVLEYARSQEARVKDLKTRAALEGLDPDALKLIGCTLRVAGDDYLESLANEGTRTNNRYRLAKHVYPHAGNLIAERMMPRDILKLQTQWELAGLGAATRRQMYILVKTIFSHLESNGAVKYENNPFHRMKTPSKPKRATPDAWPDAQISQFAGAFAKKYSNYPELGSGLGLRPGESPRE